MLACDRRDFLKALAVVATGPHVEGGTSVTPPEGFGVLVDIPNCIGCRKCEFACQQAAGFAVPPIETFDDKSVFAVHRRPDEQTFTTVNQFNNPADAGRPAFVKANCLHCIDPACVSACLVGALQREPNGAVTYDAWKCMGCRYCMIACPFQIPAYEYGNALTPQVRKCTFCFDKISQEGGVPACVRICPNDALVFGRRDDLLTEARRRIQARPEVYIRHIYGEHEAGGTSWLYLSSLPFEQVGFLSVASAAPPRLTESLQHGIFKFFMPPAALYGMLGLITWLTKREKNEGGFPGAASADAGDVDVPSEPRAIALPVLGRPSGSRSDVLMEAPS